MLENKKHAPLNRPLSEGGIPFKLVSDYTPAGDQPNAIADLTNGVKQDTRDQVLLGVMVRAKPLPWRISYKTYSAHR